MNNGIIDGNAALQSYKNRVNSIPTGSGYIRNIDTGQRVGVNDSKPYNDTKRTKVPKAPNDPFQTLYELSKRYNDFIVENNLNEHKVNYDDFFDRNSPSYIDPTNRQDVDETEQYILNQLYRMQKDDRYVPDYEDYQEMTDEEFKAYEDLLFGS